MTVHPLNTARESTHESRSSQHSPQSVTRHPSSVLLRSWKHLRIPFQLTLTPIFLWGYLLGSPGLQSSILPAFLVFHFLLYPGITAFNSYYDRDRGPIGGLQNPPSVDQSLLRTSLALKSIGFAAAMLLGREMALIYAAFIALSVLYSYPRFRWKAHPVLSSAVVAFGQGGLGFLAGWTAAEGGIEGIADMPVFVAIAGACFTTLAMYPLTQLFQVREDSNRGDRTLCVSLGPRNALALSLALLAAGGTCGTLTLAMSERFLNAAILGGGYTALILAVGRIRREFPLWTVDQTFRIVTLVHYTASAGFAAFLLLRIARW